MKVKVKEKVAVYSLCAQAGLLSLVMLVPQPLMASEAVLNPNQIKGVAEFSNKYLPAPNPQVAELLKLHEFEYSSYIFAYNSPLGLRVDAYPPASVETPDTLDYNITVSSSGEGIPYNMLITGRTKAGNYWFDRKDSAPVFPEPADDTVVDFQECAAVVDVTYKDSQGNPTEVTGFLTAEKVHTNSNGSNSYQRKAKTHYNYNVSNLTIPVHADGSSYRIRSSYVYGSNIQQDRINYECRNIITPSCDTVVPITCQIADVSDLGQIEGNFDFINTIERENRTYLWASDGPFDNLRFTGRFTSGPFTMPNMVPSDAEDIPKGYLVRAYSELGTGDNAQRYYSPYYYNNRVMVNAGQTTDITQRFQINPSIIKGSIDLYGPSLNGAQSGLHNLLSGADTDANGDGFPDDYYFSSIEAHGTTQLPEGTTIPSWGGIAKVAFGGTADANNELHSQYTLTVGGLNNESSIWNSGNLNLAFDHPEPELDGFLPGIINVRNNHYISKQLDPQQTYEGVDHQYCFSDVTLNYRSTSGKFYKPSATVYGHFNDTDFMNNAANYFVYGYNNYGLPATNGTAADTGRVKMTLPQGSYQIRPTVVPSSGDSSAYGTSLPAVHIEVGCAQKIDVSTGLQMAFDNPLPQETRDSELTVSGTLTTEATSTSVSVSVNGSDDIAVCSDCGDSFSTSVQLEEGSNSLVFNATDSEGNTASIESEVTYTPNQLTLSCASVTINQSVFAAETEIAYQLSSQSNCDSPATFSCDPDDGSLFGIGTTNVSCSAQNSCGATASCGFTVTINKPEQEPGPVCDGSAETITQELAIDSLWPANHKMVDIGFNRTATDDCGEPMSDGDIITEVWSNEPEIFVRATGGGNTAPDATNTQTDLQLRAERFGTGNGRVYLILTKDSGGNAFSCNVVTVPHNQSPAAKAAIASEAQAALEYCQQNNGDSVPGFFQHGMYVPSEDSSNGNGGGNSGGGNGNGNGDGNNGGGNGNGNGGGNNDGGNGNGNGGGNNGGGNGNGNGGGSNGNGNGGGNGKKGR